MRAWVEFQVFFRTAMPLSHYTLYALLIFFAPEGQIEMMLSQLVQEMHGYLIGHYGQFTRKTLKFRFHI